MKHIKILYCLTIFIILMTACARNNNSNHSTANTSTEAKTIQSNTHQTLDKSQIDILSDYSPNWMNIGIDEIGLKNLYMIKMDEGRFSTPHTVLPIYVFGDNSQYSDSNCHDTYLAVTTESAILFKDISMNSGGSYSDDLYVRDIDGDKIDEVILQQTVGMTGGAGQYLSRVFKVDGNKIWEIFSSSCSEEDQFDTGYTSEFLNGYKLKVKNSFTGYSKIIDISRRYTADFFDENGKGKFDIGIKCDNFFKFVPYDADDDGVFEINAEQYVSLDGHSDAIGNAQSILKFNADTQNFEVVKSNFFCD